MKKNKRLYILRHGQAEAYSASGHDTERRLTSSGEDEVSLVAQYFHQKNEKIDAVFVSPYVRTQQTAKIFLAPFEGSTKVENSSLITPYGRDVDVAGWLTELPYDSVLLVTHQPFAYELTNFLSDAPLPQQFAMSTATLVALEGDILAGACCHFRWFLTPRS